jgi:hypothetical protein
VDTVNEVARLLWATVGCRECECYSEAPVAHARRFARCSTSCAVACHPENQAVAVASGCCNVGLGLQDV